MPDLWPYYAVAEIMKVMKKVQDDNNMNNQYYSQGDIHTANSGEAKQQEFEALEDALVHIMANSCSQFCQSGGYGDGTVIGTAPFCAGACGRDCVTHCTYANSDWEDYGSGCWSGNKICCCGKSHCNRKGQYSWKNGGGYS